jgi:hypothetical protein
MIRALSVALLLAFPAGATTPAALYFGQTLLCRQQATGATCALWLNPDGRYAVFYDTGRPTLPRFQGRQGAYQLTATSLCLRPNESPAPDIGVTLFHDQGCTALPVHPIGEAFDLTADGQSYTLELVQGR